VAFDSEELGKRRKSEATSRGKKVSRLKAYAHGIWLSPTIENEVMWALHTAGVPMCPWEVHQFAGLTCDRHSVNPIMTNLHQNGHLVETGTYGKGSGGRNSERLWLAPIHLPQPKPDVYRGGGLSRKKPKAP
jgi:hypothetical protein